jgi:hypothetical protein
MQLIRVFASFSIIFCLAIIVSAQNKPAETKGSEDSRQVVVENDRFSGDVTVKMKPQVLLDNAERKLTLAMSYKMIKKDVENASILLEEFAALRFELYSKSPVNLADQDLHFLVDGKSLSIGRSSPSVPGPLSLDEDEKGRPPVMIVSTALTLSQMEQLAKGNKIEMRLGKIELTFSSSTMAAIKEFTREFINNSPTRMNSNRKGAKP